MSSLVTTSNTAGFASLLVAFFLWYRKTYGPSSSARAGLSLPPGPKPVPVLGNVRDLTAKELWLPAEKWAKEYGDVVYLHVVGQGLVFLNSPEAAYELLDKRGSIYSDKPSLVMCGDLCGCKNMIAFTGYGEQMKRQRRLMHQAFGAPAIPAYHPLIVTSTNSFLARLLASPSKYIAHTRRYAGGLTLSVVYGYEPKDAPLHPSLGKGDEKEQDPFLGMAEECVNILSNEIASGGGIWPVDIIPQLQLLPDWAPGAGFKEKARAWKKKMEDFVDVPYAWVKDTIKAGTAKPSFCSTLLEEEGDKATEEFEFDLKWTANSMYSASADTTITTVSHFLLAMMANPEALAKAQAEIDEVCGKGRLPTFEDRENLKYVEALLNEVWRWGVPVPLNLPHRLMEDDVYNGMFIPKGSLVFGNIWAMLRDEKLYPQPGEFRPERFMGLTPEEQRKMDPRAYVFGFGRRKCPGNHLVESSIWLLIASMLATLDISKPLNDAGEEVDPKVDFNNPIFRNPDAFGCTIRPRSEEAVRLIRELNEQ